MIDLDREEKNLLELLRETIKKGNYPFVSIIVNKYTGERFVQENEVDKGKIIDHSEILLIRRLLLNESNLSDYVLFSSSFPCMMCFGAIAQSQIKEVWYANPLKLTYKLGLDNALFDIKNIEMSYNLQIKRLTNYSSFEKELYCWEKNYFTYNWVRKIF